MDVYSHIIGGMHSDAMALVNVLVIWEKLGSEMGWGGDKHIVEFSRNLYLSACRHPYVRALGAE